MQSAQLVAPQRIELREMPDPQEPGPNEVTVRLRAVGICGSDMHYYLEGGCAGTPTPYPCVLGHEPAGEVAAVGPGVETLKPGQRVAVEPAIICGRCEFCRAGRHNLCENVQFMGGVQLPGLMRQWATMPAANAIAIPDSIEFRHAAVVEPLAVILHSLELVRIEAGQTVAVMGAGPIGLLSAAVARVSGAARVIVADRIPHRLAIARDMGADLTVDIRSESAVEAILDSTGGKGAHVILDAAGKPDSINPALHAVRAGGHVVLIGVPSEPVTGLELHTAINREITIHAQRRSNRNDHAAIELIESGRIDASKLVTHTFPLACADRAFATVAEYADGVAKAVVEL